MKNRKPYQPKRIIDGYRMKRQIHGRFKIIEYSRMSNDTGAKKRTLYKNLTLTEADDAIYKLELKLK